MLQFISWLVWDSIKGVGNYKSLSSLRWSDHQRLASDSERNNASSWYLKHPCWLAPQAKQTALLLSHPTVRSMQGLFLSRKHYHSDLRGSSTEDLPNIFAIPYNYVSPSYFCNPINSCFSILTLQFHVFVFYHRTFSIPFVFSHPSLQSHIFVFYRRIFAIPFVFDRLIFAIPFVFIILSLQSHLCFTNWYFAIPFVFYHLIVAIPFVYFRLILIPFVFYHLIFAIPFVFYELIFAIPFVFSLFAIPFIYMLIIIAFAIRQCAACASTLITHKHSRKEAGD